MSRPSRLLGGKLEMMYPPAGQMGHDGVWQIDSDPAQAYPVLPGREVFHLDRGGSGSSRERLHIEGKEIAGRKAGGSFRSGLDRWKCFELLQRQRTVMFVRVHFLALNFPTLVSFSIERFS